MAFCIALAVRDMRMTIEEALRAATARRRPRAAPRRRRPPGARARAPTRSILDAPSYTHLVYRPGVPLVAATLVGGR